MTADELALTELSKRTGVPYEALRAAARTGRLKARKTGKVWLSTVEAVAAAQTSGKMRTSAERQPQQAQEGEQ